VVGLGVVLAFGVSLAWSAAAIGIGPRLGFVDTPDDPGLKVHRQNAVPLGGVGVLLGVAVGWWVAGGFDPRVMGPAGALSILGLVDDRIRLSARFRLAAQGLIAIAALNLGAVPLDGWPVQAALVGVVLIVMAINAVNLFDGLDGLAGSAGLAASLGVAALALARGAEPNLGLVLAAGLGGFLYFNRHPARVFLGDNGAYLLGFLLAIGVMRASPGGVGPELWVAALVLGVFVVDLSVTVLRRAAARQPLFLGDRGHLYDRLVARGWPIGRVVGAAVMVEAAFVALTLLLDANLPD
jgi:UDP-GlcNAc:undecaprenyl-phosphate/decaprenyl-phosphate GlcNAc-1-phosphate transferase